MFWNRNLELWETIGKKADGSTGFVGTEFLSQGRQRGVELLPIRRSDCNVYDVEQLTRTLQSISLDFLINCAGYTGKPNVDRLSVPLGIYHFTNPGGVYSNFTSHSH